MKNIFRVSVFGLTLAALTTVSAVSGFAQTANPCEDTFEVKTAAFEKYKTTVNGVDKEPLTAEKLNNAKSGVSLAEAFVAKYNACEDAKPVVDHLNKKIPVLKQFIADGEFKIIAGEFDKAVKDPANVNVNAAFTYGKQIIDLKPDLALDVSLVLGSIGYNQSIKNPPVTTYDAETLNHAKKAIQMIESGKTSKNYGALKFAFGSKDNALAWMNYAIGSILLYNQKNQKDALPYFYKATQYNSDVKKRADLYQAIGAWYLEDVLKKVKEYNDAVTANEGKENEQTQALLAVAKGYAERAADAYARAYKLAGTDAEYKKELYTKLEGLYKIRFDNKTEGIEAFATAALAKPLPDPNSAVTPVQAETPAATTTTSSTTTTTPSTTDKPAENTTRTTTEKTTTPATDKDKPANTTTKPTTTTKSSTSTKVSSKTTTKKKGIR